MVNKFELKKTFKVRFFNFFRNVFLISTFERWLVNLVVDLANDHILRKLIPPSYLYSSSSIREVERNGIMYELDISNVNDHFIFYNYRDIHLNNIIKHLIENTTIIDIGANIGQSLLFLNRHCEGLKIIGFEPHPETFKKALKNVELNGLDNVVIENCGLGDRKENIKLYEVNPSNIGMNRALPKNVDVDSYGFVEMRVKVLDDYVDEHNIVDISLIKIDVEGFEHNVLRGAQKIISKWHPTILLELDDHNLKECNSSAKELIDFLMASGYQIFNAMTLKEVGYRDDLFGIHMDIICVLPKISLNDKI